MILRFLGTVFNSSFNLLILLFIVSALSGSDCSIIKDNSSIFSFKFFLLLSTSGSCGDTKPMGVNVLPVPVGAWYKYNFGPGTLHNVNMRFWCSYNFISRYL